MITATQLLSCSSKRRNLIYSKVIALELFGGSIMWEENTHSVQDNTHLYKSISWRSRAIPLASTMRFRIIGYICYKLTSTTRRKIL